ncbi:MAG: prepilin-type N-terminal cleavage/methylation domain-containing protein [Agathobacter sp.]|nr:prepilin-type N-terminal cleavage/methylation domain-containing protein [Agathobacter sp.]
MRKKKHNNSGFSLVELIVTITILAIVVFPLLNAFVLSARTNAKAKERLRLTSIAENMMEGIEKMSLEELAYQFDYPQERFNLISTSLLTNDESGALPVYELTNEGTTYQKAYTYEQIKKQMEDAGYEFSGWDTMIHSSIRTYGTERVFEGQSSRSYYFFMKNMSAGSGSKRYSALISVKPNDVKSYNDTTLASIQSINVSTDALYADAISTSTVLALFPVEETSPTTDEHGNEVAPAITTDKITRSIELNVRNISGVETVELVYNYSAKDSGGNTLTYNLSSTLFDNGDAPEQKLENVYLLYFPWYQGASDSITVNNPDNVDFTLHLIKQKGSDQAADDAALAVCEATYKMDLYVKETSPDAKGHSHCDIQSNLNENLATKAAASQIRWCQYNSNAASNVWTDVLQGRSITTPAAKWDRLFDVTVEIYDGSVDVDSLMGAQPLATFTGGMTN